MNYEIPRKVTKSQEHVFNLFFNSICLDLQIRAQMMALSSIVILRETTWLIQSFSYLVS